MSDTAPDGLNGKKFHDLCAVEKFRKDRVQIQIWVKPVIFFSCEIQILAYIGRFSACEHNDSQRDMVVLTRANGTWLY